MGEDAPQALVSAGHGQMTQAPWDRRIERAGELALEIPEAAELLRFYGEVARFQSTVGGEPLEADYERLVTLMGRIAPAAVLTETEYLWRVVRQPWVERQAKSSGVVKTTVQPRCPYCGELPLAAVLRPEGEGGKRFLICSLCFTEWEFRRLLCPQCGEERQEKLPILTAEQFPHVRVEACESCHVYTKAIDLTRNGLAVPEVDELATVALDLWAGEQEYVKLQVNVLGL